MSTIGIPVETSSDPVRGEHFLSVPGPNNRSAFSMLDYGSLSTVRKRFVKRVVDTLAEYATAARNYQRKLIVCGDGTVMVVEWRLTGGYQHTITGPGRNHTGSTIGNWTTLEEATAAAIAHAESGYGGVVGTYPL